VYEWKNSTGEMQIFPPLNQCKLLYEMLNKWNDSLISCLPLSHTITMCSDIFIFWFRPQWFCYYLPLRKNSYSVFMDSKWLILVHRCTFNKLLSIGIDKFYTIENQHFGLLYTILHLWYAKKGWGDVGFWFLEKQI
jgi:hypothetical protein